MAYAENTTATPERRQMEIAAPKGKYGAETFGTGWQAGFALVTFNAHNRQIQFVLPIPENWREYVRTPGRRSRTEADAKKAMEAETRRRWRALALTIEAKLEVVDTGIASFEHEFGMNIA
jgi:hypothetical protein